MEERAWQRARFFPESAHFGVTSHCLAREDRFCRPQTIQFERSPSAMNKEFVVAYKKAFGSRPGFMAVSGYDGIHLIYEALKKTSGKTDGDALVEAMKGMKWESPRGPISIDPETRDIVQNIYIRKVERVDGELYNVEFATFEAVKDAGKTKKWP
jgi:branched-chain amino acid transport system substrate-binding protein